MILLVVVAVFAVVSALFAVVIDAPFVSVFDALLFLLLLFLPL